MELRLRRLSRNGTAGPAKPYVVVDMDARAQTIVALSPYAAALGLRPGMTLAQARAIEPILTVARANPVEDAYALDRLAVWFLRYSPLVAPSQPDGIWIDATGVAHLFGGESAMLAKIVARLSRDTISARVAMAETPGAAWACARYGEGGVVEAGAVKAVVSPMPLAALRLSRPVVESLNRVGLTSVGQLLRIPRATIPHRFGADVLKRLDQAMGALREPINPVLPPTAKRQSMSFAEPIGTPEDLQRVIALLTERLCRDLETNHEGARRLDVLFQRSDGQTEAIRVGVARASRDYQHLAKLLTEKLSTVDPGLGIDAATLTAWRTEALTPEQTHIYGDVDIDRRALAQLSDRLTNRLGAGQVYRLAPVESDIPERAMKRLPVDGDTPGDWPKDIERPMNLLTPPEPVEVTAMLPDHPPVMFQWRGRLHRVKRADGPERIFGEWWQQPNEIAEVRDYFRVENERGERYWLYRDSRLTAHKTYRWYLHGVFA